MGCPAGGYMARETGLAEPPPSLAADALHRKMDMLASGRV